MDTNRRQEKFILVPSIRCNLRSELTFVVVIVQLFLKMQEEGTPCNTDKASLQPDFNLCTNVVI